MQLDISASIAELLYEHQSVSLPGLGSFVSNYKQATVDQVEGKIQPPSKQLNFNRNLLMDDGLLVQHLRKKYNVSYPTAMLAVEQFVQDAKTAIEKREIFTIPGVGRLYKDYEHNFQFLPDDVNFNTDSYGLPTVSFYPVMRNQRETPVKETTGTPVQAKKQAAPAAVSGAGKGFGAWLQRNLVLVSSGVLVIAAVVVYLQFFNQPNQTGEEVPGERYNVSPSKMTSEEQMESSAARDTETDDPALDDVDDSETEGATPQPEQQYAMIGIGLFGQKENVDRLVQEIFEAGYEPYTEKKGDLTRVGIQVAYKSEQDIQKALKDIRDKFDSKAQVLKRVKK